VVNMGALRRSLALLTIPAVALATDAVSAGQSRPWGIPLEPASAAVIMGDPAGADPEPTPRQRAARLRYLEAVRISEHTGDAYTRPADRSRPAGAVTSDAYLEAWGGTPPTVEEREAELLDAAISAQQGGGRRRRERIALMRVAAWWAAGQRSGTT
jgi:hypothetical protein